MNRAEELRTLANVQEEIGDYNAALDLHRRAFLLQEKAVGKSSPELAPFIYELAMVHGALDHDGEAARLLNWLVTIVPGTTRSAMKPGWCWLSSSRHKARPNRSV